MDVHRFRVMNSCRVVGRGMTGNKRASDADQKTLVSRANVC